MPQIERFNPDLNLADAFVQDVGYHGTCWIDLNGEESKFDRDVPAPLQEFVGEVSRIVKEGTLRGLGGIGCAYLRVIDGAHPENYMRWHIDNQDGGVRFHTAISTDGTPVNLAWPEDQSFVGQPVEDTEWGEAYQPDNGVIVGFTTEPHGVLPLPERPGEKTAIFFATMYDNREQADLYTTNNTTGSQHGTLPSLDESQR